MPILGGLDVGTWTSNVSVFAHSRGTWIGESFHYLRALGGARRVYVTVYDVKHFT